MIKILPTQIWLWSGTVFKVPWIKRSERKQEIPITEVQDFTSWKLFLYPINSKLFNHTPAICYWVELSLIYIEYPFGTMMPTMNDPNASTFLNSEHLKSEHLTFVNTFLSGFQMVWLGIPFQNQTFFIIKRHIFFCFSDHHSKTRPFDNQTHLDHLNTRLVRYSDGYCSS